MSGKVRQRRWWGIKDPRAVRPLIALLKDEDSWVRERAARGLKTITGKGFGEDPKKWQEWWELSEGEFLKSR